MARRLAPDVNNTDQRELAVVATPGLEFITLTEMASLGIPGRMVEPGLIECRGGIAEIRLLNRSLRTASRILVRIGSCNAAAFSELHKKAARMPWASYLRPSQPVLIRVTTHASRLYHKKGIAERVATAISEAIGGDVVRTSGDEEDAGSDAQLILVRIVRNLCQISIDASGAHLHRRGYKLEVGKAPLRETLAAAILLASGWDRNSPLVDPFCGAGTLVIEAALLAAGIPPGHLRHFAFERWPGYVPPTGLPEDAPVKTETPIIGYDRDAGAIAAAQANAARAGVADRVIFARRSISELTLPDRPGWMVTNPPYGERIKGGPDLRNLYARMDSVWRSMASMWHIYMVSSSPRWLGQMQMSHETIARFAHGGLPVSLEKLSVKEP